MKILIASPRLPYPWGKADSITVYRLLKYFSRKHEIYLVCFCEDPDELSFLPELKKHCRLVQVVPLKKWKILLNMSRVVFNDIPLQISYYLDKRMEKTINTVIEKYQPDLAYAHLIRMAQYLKNKSETKRVLAMQISQTLNYRRMIANIKSPFYRVLYNLEYHKVRSYEPAITHYFDSCLLISPFDKESLAGHENIDNIFYSPHGVDVAYYTPSGREEKENALLFSGVMETPTNIDAVTYFCQTIYPLIKREIPGVNLWLVGKNPARAIKKFAENDPSITVTGFVKDLRPYFEKARVGIDPLRIGAGLQNKLLIGMSMGLPMVCTSIANEGIGAEKGRHLLIADEPQAFAADVVELFRDQKKSQEIARQARRYVEKYWTWEYHFQALENHLKKLVGRE